MTKNGAKKDEKTEISFVVHIMYFSLQSLFLCYVFWHLVVNILLRELLFLYNYIETLAYESGINSQLRKLCLKKLVLKSSISAKMVLLPAHRRMKSKEYSNGFEKAHSARQSPLHGDFMRQSCWLLSTLPSNL